MSGYTGPLHGWRAPERLVQPLARQSAAGALLKAGASVLALAAGTGGFAKPARAVPGETFTCAMCGGTFAKAWSDEEAAAEASRDHPDLSPARAAVVCDPCYRKITPPSRREV